MSYVNKKTRAFRDAHDVVIPRKRSEGRMKTYFSAIDARCWCDSREQRRQYILELITQGERKGSCLGKLIPIEAILDILLASKNADIDRLKAEIDFLKQLLKKNGIDISGESTRKKDAHKKPEVTGADQLKGVSSVGKEGDDKKGLKGDEDADEARRRAAAEEAARRAAAEEAARRAAAEEAARRAAAAARAGGDDLALAAIERLEEIDDIVDDSGKSGPSRSKEELQKERGGYDKDNLRKRFDNTEPLPDKVRALKNRCRRCNRPRDEVVHDTPKREDPAKQEDPNLLAKIAELENALESCRKQPSDDGEKRRLLARIAELEKALENCAKPSDDGEKRRLLARVAELERALEHCAKPSDDGEKRRLLARIAELEKTLENCGKAEDNERRKSLSRIAELERELDNMRNRLKECEVIRVERDSLKSRLADHCNTQKDYDDLCKKTKGFDSMKSELAACKAKCAQLCRVEEECNELKVKAHRSEQLVEERRLLMKDIEECECCMTNQQDEIKRLSRHIDCLTHDLDKRQDDMKQKVQCMKSDICKKDTLIAKSEQELADVQHQLRKSIESLSCETNCLRNRIAALEKLVREREAALKAIECEKCCLLRRVESGAEENKALRELLDNEMKDKDCLQRQMKDVNTTDDQLKKMLHQAKCAVKCITNKLEKYDIVSTTSSAEQDKTIAALVAENEALRQLAADLQEAAKKEITCLKERSSEAEDHCADLREQLDSQTSEVCKLTGETNVLNAEIDRLQFELEREKQICCMEIDRLKQESEQLLDQMRNMEEKSVVQTEKECPNCAEEAKRLRLENEQLNVQVQDLNVQLKDLKDEMNKMKQADSCKDSKERAELLAQIEAQKKEISELLGKIKQPLGAADSTILRERCTCTKESSFERLEKQLKNLPKAQITVPKGSSQIEKSLKDLQDSLEEEEKKVKKLEDCLRKCQEESRELKKRCEQIATKKKDKQKEETGQKGVTSQGANSRVKELEDQLTKTKLECTENITSLKEQFDRDLKNLQRQNCEAISKLQRIHQEEMCRIKKQYEAELAMLKKQLRKSGIREESCTWDKQSSGTTSPGATPPRQMISAVVPQNVMPSLPFMFQPPPMAVEKPQDQGTSLKKIVDLENKLLLKQQHTKQKIDLLQETVDKFKKELDLEKQRNNDLFSRYTNQTKAVANMKVEMAYVKRENINDKKRLEELNHTLQEMMQGGCSRQCSYKPTIPHFHTEVKSDNACKMIRTVKAWQPCKRPAGDRSNDSFEIDE